MPSFSRVSKKAVLGEQIVSDEMLSAKDARNILRIPFEVYCRELPEDGVTDERLFCGKMDLSALYLLGAVNDALNVQGMERQDDNVIELVKDELGQTLERILSMFQ